MCVNDEWVPFHVGAHRQEGGGCQSLGCRGDPGTLETKKKFRNLHQDSLRFEHIFCLFFRRKRLKPYSGGNFLERKKISFKESSVPFAGKVIFGPPPPRHEVPDGKHEGAVHPVGGEVPPGAAAEGVQLPPRRPGPCAVTPQPSVAWLVALQGRTTRGCGSPEKLRAQSYSQIAKGFGQDNAKCQPEPPNGKLFHTPSHPRGKPVLWHCRSPFENPWFLVSWALRGIALPSPKRSLAMPLPNWIIHRDLKTSNLLYSNNGVLKACPPPSHPAAQRPGQVRGAVLGVPGWSGLPS